MYFLSSFSELFLVDWMPYFCFVVWVPTDVHVDVHGFLRVKQEKRREEKRARERAMEKTAGR